MAGGRWTKWPNVMHISLLIMIFWENANWKMPVERKRSNFKLRLHKVADTVGYVLESCATPVKYRLIKFIFNYFMYKTD